MAEEQLLTVDVPSPDLSSASCVAGKKEARLAGHLGGPVAVGYDAMAGSFAGAAGVSADHVR